MYLHTQINTFFCECSSQNKVAYSVHNISYEMLFFLQRLYMAPIYIKDSEYTMQIQYQIQNLSPLASKNECKVMRSETPR